MDLVQEENALLAEIQQLRDHGRYKEAVELLRSEAGKLLLSPAELALELGQSLRSQGYWAEAMATWQNYLQEIPSDSMSSWIINVRIRMYVHLMHPMLQENLNGLAASFEQAQRAYAEFTSIKCPENNLEHEIHIRDSYCKMLRLVSQYLLPQKAPQAFEWLKPTFELCLSRKEYRLALVVANQYVASVTEPFGPELTGLDMDGWKSMVQSLMNSVSMPPVIRAKALDLLAEFSESTGAPLPREAYEKEATELYEQCDHMHGAAEIHVRQLSRQCAAGEGNLDDHVARISRYLETFEQQDYVFGIYSGLQVLQSSLSDTRFFSFQLNLIQASRDIVEKSGARMLYMLVQSKAIAVWLLHSGRAPRVVEAGLLLYESVDEANGRRFKAMVADILAQAYLQLDDFDAALSWARKRRDLLSLSLARDCAEAATLELRILVAQALSNLRAIDLDRLVHDWDLIIEREMQQGLGEAAVEKLESLLMLLTRARDARVSRYLERIESTIGLLGQSAGKTADLKLAALYQAFAAAQMSHLSTRQSNVEAQEYAIDLLDKAVPLYMKHTALFEAGNTRQMQALAHYGLFQVTRDFARLSVAFDLTAIALDCFRLLDLTAMVSVAAYWCAFYAFAAWNLGRGEAALTLDQLGMAEKAKDAERIELSVFGGLDALIRKQRMRADNKTQQVYEMAMTICLRANMAHELWQWTQKSKARSLSDLLALGVLVPERLQADIHENPATKMLFEEERQLQQEIDRAESAEKINLRSRLQIVQQQMEEHPALHELMALRAGNAITHQQLDDLVTRIEQNSEIRTNVVFIDWNIVDGQIFMVSVRNHDPARFDLCAISEQELRAWKSRYLDTATGFSENIQHSDFDEDDEEYCLRQIDGLIAPIADLTEKDDLLVLCATGPLHSIPLHALWIEEEPLIVHNPIVYCASLTSAWQCWSRVLETCCSETTEPAAPVPRTPMKVVAVYDEVENTGFTAKEQVHVYESAGILCAATGADGLVGDEATISGFTESIVGSSLFHFHGHCNLDRDVLMEQSIILADGALSIRDVFKLKLASSPHITLVACDSAAQGISSRGDEPLGLVTALLCAGASSVLGNIWPVASATGRDFAMRFYEKLGIASEAQGGMGEATNAVRGLVSLAEALRETVMEIRGKVSTRSPFNWASFVLHGSPIMERRD